MKSSHYDVIIAGGGPAGCVMAWKLSSAGLKVLLLERDSYPREKVCGDFIEPRGLRVLDLMGCLSELSGKQRLPINFVSIYLRSVCEYKGRIPLYGLNKNLPSNGFIIPRYEFDNKLAEVAGKSGAEIIERASVKSVDFKYDRVSVTAEINSKNFNFDSEIIVGADGVHSVVARSAGMLSDDPRYTAVSQRAYAEGLTGELGESAFFFDEDLFPGYGWMFPMPGGCANVGVGILSESKKIYDIQVSHLFKNFIQKLKASHPFCGNIIISSKPIGGIVKTYGGRAKNFFDRGILVGDAGSFVDPMTGEGITAAMESSMIGASVIIKAFEKGKFDSTQLNEYEKRFSSYFDPSLLYVDFVACIMRNREFSGLWLDIVTKGCRLAKSDEEFLKITGATFGGMEIYPTQILRQVWEKAVYEFNPVYGMLKGDFGILSGSLSDFTNIQLSAWKSFVRDPVWHSRWAAEVMNKFIKLFISDVLSDKDIRVKGPVV